MVGRGYLGGRCGTCGRLYKVEKGDCISTPHISGPCYSRLNHWRLDVKNNIVSHIKFTIKDGCMDDFVAAQAKIDNDPLFAALRTFTIQPEENVFIVTNIYDDIDQVMSIQEKALQWLDEIEPRLVCSEDGSRTEACSGPITFGRCEVIPCAPY